MSEEYVTKAEILQWCKPQRPRMTESDIPDHIMNMATAKVKNTLIRNLIYDVSAARDRFNFLKMAATCFALALLCKAEIITQTSGEIATEKFKDVTYQFQRTQPMFFFAAGSSEPFQQLLPHETLRMLAYEFVRGYRRYKFYLDTGQKQPKGKVVRDNSSRGYGWNISPVDIDIADAATGDILPGDDTKVYRTEPWDWSED